MLVFKQLGSFAATLLKVDQFENIVSGPLNTEVQTPKSFVNSIICIPALGSIRGGAVWALALTWAKDPALGQGPAGADPGQGPCPGL